MFRPAEERLGELLTQSELNLTDADMKNLSSRSNGGDDFHHRLFVMRSLNLNIALHQNEPILPLGEEMTELAKPKPVEKNTRKTFRGLGAALISVGFYLGQLQPLSTMAHYRKHDQISTLDT